MVTSYINQAKSLSQNRVKFQEAMNKLAQALRNKLSCDYCAIGMVADGIAEDSAVAYEKSNDEKTAKLQEETMNQVRSADERQGDTYVSKALNSDKDISFYPLDPSGSKFFDSYKTILKTDNIEHAITTVIPIRDNEKHNFGFVQLIHTSTDNQVDYEHDILPIKDSLLELVQIIIQHKLIQKDLRLKDADFYSQMQDKRDNVDGLLDSIMEYFSKEFNAAIVSFRIPLLNGYDKKVIFYLRSLYIHQSIDNDKTLNNIYYTDRFIKTQSDMRIIDELRCDHQGKILVSPADSDFIQYGLELNLYNNTLVIPIFHDNENKCSNPEKENRESFCPEKEHLSCTHRFKRLYGIFRLRISKIDLSRQDNEFDFDLKETNERLAYLSQQITLLFNSIVEKHENESLKKFQEQLKDSSFIKIQDFDERCVEIIKESVLARVCSIYRYDDRTKLLTLSATTAKIIKFRANDHDLFFKPERIKQSCFIHINSLNNLLARAYQKRQCEYVLNIHNNAIHQSTFIEFIKSDNDQETAIAVPMIKKDGTCAGVVLLLGKDKDKDKDKNKDKNKDKDKVKHTHSISTAYWEHDINHIEFIVNTLTRISESDTERLTFLSHLSHELLAPVTELVYDNDLTLNIAERNFDSISKRQLIAKIRENIDHNLLFKYIINDTEFIYSSTGRSVDYNIVKQNRPQAILLDAIRLLEKKAVSKGLSIRTYISEMPPLYFDRERMMQVFINLLKNAIRYADSHTEISISYNRRDDGIHEIRFANVGIEILEEERETIFELFHRGKEAQEKIPKGTGMGLYIARDIMRAHGGDCYVRRLDNPTEFAITLPNRE